MENCHKCGILVDIYLFKQTGGFCYRCYAEKKPKKKTTLDGFMSKKEE